MPITPSPAVVRAGEALRHLARHPTTPFSVSELARELGVPRATCDAILQGLAEGGFVIRREDDLRYELGPSCIPLGDAARIANPVLRAAGVEAEQLARALAACAAVTVVDGDESRVADVFDYGPPFGPHARVGLSIAHAPPFGAVYVAWDPEDAEAWIARGGATLGTRATARYRRALEEVRRRGYSVSVAPTRRPELITALETLATTPDAEHARRTRDELMAEMLHSEYLATDLETEGTLRVNQMSAPVFDRTGRAVASILVIGPDYEITTAALRARGERLLAAAARATSVAGGRVPTDRS
jgi:DNA-binding IclR family transcriptional regulator